MFYGFSKEQFRLACHNRFCHLNIDDFLLSGDAVWGAGDDAWAVHDFALHCLHSDIHIAYFCDALVDWEKFRGYIMQFMSEEDVQKHLEPV